MARVAALGLSATCSDLNINKNLGVHYIDVLPEDATCDVCYSDKNDTEDFSLMHLGCGHSFCLDCWRGHLSCAVGANEHLRATCMHASCNMLVGPDAFTQLLPVGEVHRFERQMLLSFVNDSEAFVWCPSPGCGASVAFSKRRLTVQCMACSTKFCFRCSGLPHAPVSCDNAKQWLEKEELTKTGGGKLVTELNLKPCPNPACNAPTEKTGGCMHMVCRQCHCNWCWQCGQWGGGKTGRPLPHHVYKCNKPPDGEWQSKGGELFSEDGHFAFYLERYNNHAASEKLSEKQRLAAKAMIEATTESSVTGAGKERRVAIEHSSPNSAVAGGGTPGGRLCRAPETKTAFTTSDVQFISDATEVVIECRVVLKWTYAFAFFERDDKARVLFEYTQNMLENNAEKLSGLIEQPCAEVVASKEDIRTLIVVVRNLMNSLMEDTTTTDHGGERGQNVSPPSVSVVRVK